MTPWIGFDLDGTLALYNGWTGGSIGEPIPEMIERCKAYLDKGYLVKIVTARVSASEPEEVELQTQLIEQWCEEHLGEVLEITCCKDYQMVDLYDDRATQVVKNKGICIEDVVDDYRDKINYLLRGKMMVGQQFTFPDNSIWVVEKDKADREAVDAETDPA